MNLIETETAWNIITQNAGTSFAVDDGDIIHYAVAFKSSDFPELELTEDYGVFTSDSNMLFTHAYNAGATLEEATGLAAEASYHQMEANFC